MTTAKPSVEKSGGQTSLMRKLTWLILLPLSFEIFFVVLLSTLLICADQESRKLEGAKQTGTVCAELVKTVYKTTGSAFLYAAQHDEFNRNSYQEGRSEFSNLLTKLRDLCRSDPKAFRSAEILSVLSRRLITQLDNIMDSSSGPLLQYASVSGSIALTLHQIMEHCSTITNLQAQVQSHRATGINWQLIIFIVLAFGLVASIVASLAILRYVHRDLVSRIVVMVDNTHKVAAQKELNQAVSGRDELAELDHFIHRMDAAIREAESRRQQFMSTLTHDMRTPLSQVQFLLGMLAEGKFDEDAAKRKERIRKIFPEITRLGRLIEDMLTLDKLDSHMLELEKKEVDVSRLLEEVKDAIENEASARNNAVSVTALPGRREDNLLVAKLDEFQIKRVLVNLCSNALKYSAPGTSVEVTCIRENSFLRCEVADSGPGVPDELKSRLFERYQQGMDETKQQGFGLGLHICKLLVEAHGGEIAVKNRSDGASGAVFYFSIPSEPA